MVKQKRYPLIVSLIVSCVIVIVSLFILGFFGMRLGNSLAGGSQFEISISKDADTKDYVSKIKSAVKENGYSVSSAFVEDKYASSDNAEGLTPRCIVVTISSKNISDEKESAIRSSVASALELDVSSVSSIETTTSSVKSKNVLFVGLSIGIIAICLFVLGLVRYNIFAGLSFILSFLHNIILYFSVVILSRVEFSLVALTAIVLMTLAMSCYLIQVFEKDRELSLMKTGEKQSIPERVWSAEKSALAPFAFIVGAVLIFAGLMFIPAVASVRFSALNILIGLAITLYTSLLIGPGAYANMLELREESKNAVLSRNDAVNKQIQKKVKKSQNKTK